MKTKAVLLIVALTAIIVITGCSRISESAPYLELNEYSLYMDVGDTFPLEVNSSTDTDLNRVSWKSDNSSVVSVKSSGMVAVISALAAGSATITVSADGYPSLKVPVTVEPVLNALYVAPWGSDDDGDGSFDYPYFTINKAERDSRVGPGSTVYIRGGVYRYPPEIAELESTNTATPTARNSYVLIFHMSKSGEPGKPIRYFAYPGDPRPVFDLTDIIPGESEALPNPKRVRAFAIGAEQNNLPTTVGATDRRTNYLHFKGFDVIGMQVVVIEHTGSEAFRVYGDYNIFENLAVHHGMATGFYLSEGSNNLFLNCDAYNNWDTVSEGGSGENTDGFGFHAVRGSLDNKIIGCRAWANSDDGFDCIRQPEAVFWDNSWSFYNGYSQEPDGSFVSRGNGQGFKAGGWGMSPAPENFPPVMPRHTVQFCISANNCSNGFDGNYQYGTGSNWYNNISYNHTVNFNMQSRERGNFEDIWSVPGYGHRLVNNLSYKPGKKHIDMINYARSVVTHNSWDLGANLTDDDFYSVDITELTWPRKADGSLPDINFLRPKPGSKLIDAGIFIPETTTDRIDPQAGAEYTGQKVRGVNYFSPLIIPPESETTWDADSTMPHPYTGLAPNIGVYQ